MNTARFEREKVMKRLFKTSKEVDNDNPSTCCTDHDSDSDSSAEYELDEQDLVAAADVLYVDGDVGRLDLFFLSQGAHKSPSVIFFPFFLAFPIYHTTFINTNNKPQNCFSFLPHSINITTESINTASRQSDGEKGEKALFGQAHGHPALVTVIISNFLKFLAFLSWSALTLACYTLTQNHSTLEDKDTLPHDALLQVDRTENRGTRHRHGS